MNILAQVFGLIALSFYATSFQYNKKKKILKLQILSNLFYGLQYLMLNAYSGLYVSMIGMTRSLIFNKFEEKKTDIPRYVLFVLWGLVLVGGIISYINPISLIPTLIGLLNAYGLWQKKLKKYRIIAMICSIGWITYNSTVGAYVGTFAAVIELSACVIAYIRYDIKKRVK